MKQTALLLPGARVVVHHRHLGYAVVAAEPIEGVVGPWEFPRKDVEVVA
jgi:hypothetical protein